MTTKDKELTLTIRNINELLAAQVQRATAFKMLLNGELSLNDINEDHLLSYAEKVAYKHVLYGIWTVGDLMTSKVLFIKNLLGDIPIGSSNCYFCIKHSSDCKNCWYGKNKGVCDSMSVHSTYRKLCDAIGNLQLAINNYWTDKDADNFKEISVKQEYIEKVKLNLISFMNSNISNTKYFIDKLNRVTNVSELMQLKVNILSNTIAGIPLSNEHCVFCIECKTEYHPNQEYCNYCWYGKVKGKCSDNGSVLRNILNTISNLNNEITNYWTYRDTMLYNHAMMYNNKER